MTLAALGHHQADEQHAAEVDAFAAQRVHGRQQHVRLDLFVDALAELRDGREHAHAAGVRADVAVADALVVLHRFEDAQRLAVGEHEHARLFALEVLFDEDAHAGLAVAPLFHQGVDDALALARVVDDVDALACGEAVGLDDLRPGRAAFEVPLGAAAAIERARGRRGNAVLLEEVL